MNRSELPERQRAESCLKWQIGRRSLLKLMGAAGISAVFSPVLPALLGNARLAEEDEQGTAPPKRLRRAMIKEWQTSPRNRQL